MAGFALAALALIGLLAYEPSLREPLLELRFFTSVPFSGAAAIALIAFAAVGGFALITTLYLQEVRDYSALQAGFLFVPVAAAAIISGPISGRLVANRGPRLSLIAAGAALTLCAVMLTGLTATTSIGWLVASYVVFGLGFGMVSAPVNNTALSGMPRSQSGVAAAIVSTGRQAGQTLGVAVAGALLASSLHGSLHAGLAPASQPVWWVMAGTGVVVVVLAIVTTTTWAQRTALALGREAAESAA